MFAISMKISITAHYICLSVSPLKINPGGVDGADLWRLPMRMLDQEPPNFKQIMYPNPSKPKGGNFRPGQRNVRSGEFQGGNFRRGRFHTTGKKQYFQRHQTQSEAHSRCRYTNTKNKYVSEFPHETASNILKMRRVSFAPISEPWKSVVQDLHCVLPLFLPLDTKIYQQNWRGYG